MFAAGNNAQAALESLLDRGASVSIRDRCVLVCWQAGQRQTPLQARAARLPAPGCALLTLPPATTWPRPRRGRNVLGYAAEGSEVRRVLEARIAEMESRAARLQVGSARRGGAQAGLGSVRRGARGGSIAAAVLHCTSCPLSQAPLSFYNLQEELLAELLEDEAAGAQAKEQQRPGKKGKKKKGKAGGKFKAVAEPAAAEVGEAAAAAEEAEAQPEQPSSQPAAEQAAEAAPEGPPPAAQPAADGEGALEGDDERPSSPDWQVVGKPSRQQRSGVNASQQHHHHHQHPGQLDGGSLHLRRCPSASSLGSSCSGDSHETVGGSSVGSQRSVLVHPSRSSSAAGRAAASKPAGSKPVVIMAASPPTKPAWGKLAAAVALAVPAAPPAPQPAQDQVEPQQPAAAQQPVQAAAAGGVPAGLPLAEAQDAAALAAEVAALRAQLVQGQLERQQAEDRHQLELAAVVEEAARHEAAAVAQAAAAERTRCIFRFAAFLQSSPVAPELLASYGLTGAAASFPAATISGPAVAAPAFPADTPLAGLARLGKSAPVPVPAAPAPLLGGDLCAAGSLSPLSASPPFCYSGLEQRLREEFAGDMSCFLQPAAAELG